MLALEDDEGIRFCWEYDVASLTPDAGTRWQAVLRDGSVLHRPTAPPPGPWLKCGSSRILPQWLQRVEGGWRNEAGFFMAGPWLEPVVVPGPGAPVEGLPCGLDEVLSLEADSEECIWHTERGDVRWGESVTQVAARFAGLVLVKRGLYVNFRRLGRIRLDAGSETISLLDDRGELLAQIQRRTHQEVAQRFGLPHFEYLEPHTPALARWKLRDWPLELALARADFLRAHFDRPATLIMNVVWQAVRYRQLGIVKDYGDDYRGFFYDTLYATLYRAGMLDRPSEDVLWASFQKLVAEAVGADRLFTFEELGFADPAPGMRCLGTTRPEVVIVAEKSSLAENLGVLRERYGVSTIITGGQPKLLAVEYFVKAVRERVAGPIRVIAYVDYDPAGWLIGANFVTMLLRYGLLLDREIQYLVRAHHFSAEEVELFALPCPSETGTINAKWLAESGGFGGRMLGMHCSHLRPLERVLAAFEEIF